jgi:thiamine kinase-like enzyme
VHMSRELSLNKKEIMKTRNTLRPFFVDPFWKDRGRILLHNFESILQALKWANIRHNDLHMRNIMIYPDNRIWLIDFWLTTFS